jgi:peptidoglycan hydrolase-like protein with peptidoglycan-binding domain
VIAGRLSIDELDEQDQSALELDILFGSLDPIEELSGVQKRLVNLGFDCPVDGEVSDETTAAIEAFQRLFSLPVTGAVDNATRQKLTAMNESVSKYPDEPPDPE